MPVETVAGCFQAACTTSVFVSVFCASLVPVCVLFEIKIDSLMDFGRWLSILVAGGAELLAQYYCRWSRSLVGADFWRSLQLVPVNWVGSRQDLREWLGVQQCVVQRCGFHVPPISMQRSFGCLRRYLEIGPVSVANFYTVGLTIIDWPDCAGGLETLAHCKA